MKWTKDVKEWFTFWVFVFAYGATVAFSLFDFFFFEVLSYNPIISLVSAGVLAFGLILRSVTHEHLGKFFDINIKIREDHQIIQIGIYKYLRHPMYLANILIFLGVGGIFSSILGIITAIFLVIPATLFRIRREERYLLGKFKEKYEEYIERTDNLVPWIY